MEIFKVFLDAGDLAVIFLGRLGLKSGKEAYHVFPCAGLIERNWVQGKHKI